LERRLDPVFRVGEQAADTANQKARELSSN